MPKVLIREYDNSTTGIPASDNFAVVVPGYFGTPDTYKEGGITKNYSPKDILIDHDVYELKSQSDFIKYIGKRPGLSKSAIPPALHIINNAEDANEYTQYLLTTIELSEFDKYFDNTNTDHIYRAQIIKSNFDSSDFGKNGKLLTTISYKEKIKKTEEVEQADGTKTSVTVYEDAPATTPWSTVTLKLTKIESLEDINWKEVKDEGADNGKITISTIPEEDKGKYGYCIVSEGDEGSNGVKFSQMGNQIAYELLGLGYTVLYKKLDEDVETQKLEKLNDVAFWEPLKDKSVFNFRYVMTGGYYSASAMNRICDLAKFNNDTSLEKADTYDNLSGRGDCIALCDIDETTFTTGMSLGTTLTKIGDAAKKITKTNEYSALFAPKVTYVMADDEVSAWDRNKTFPASFHYLACAAKAFERYGEWYAVAGYNRGTSNYAVETTSVKLGEIAVNTLAPRILNTYTNKSVNLILHERGNYYLWGNRTGHTLDDKGLVFHHFLNIRQLCCSIKKQLYTACRQFTFDPNSDLLWINFVNAIKPTLEAMKADQGIKGYTISRVANDKKALLTARIRIVPIEAVEDFDISIYLEDSLTGIVVSADETQA